MADTLRVLVTGAAGQIAYSLLYSIGKGDVFGPDQSLTLVLLDIPPMMGVLEGVVMELEDCSLPLVKNVVATADPKEAFTDADFAILVGAMPRREGMERADLLKANVKIFESQGKAIDQYAKKTIKVLVVGNPANTNCLICMKNAPSIPKANFTCMTRLDQNRAQAQIAGRLSVPCNAVQNVIIWGNHSSTQFPDAAHASVDINGKRESVQAAVKDDDWLNGEFIKTVQVRGASIIKARKLSSAMSAAKAICDHMKNWWFGTPEGSWVSMGVFNDGSYYGIPGDLIYSLPVTIQKGGSWTVVPNLSITDFAREKMDLTAKELVDERDIALQFIQ